MHIDRVLLKFENFSFTTAQFIEQFKKYYPKTWAAIVDRYGHRGDDKGSIYTASSFIATRLDKRRYNRTLLKIEYVKSPIGWGAPKITVWANLSFSEKCLYPDELPNPDEFTEGAKTTIIVNRYERDTSAREKCIEHYGANCSVCSMNFAKIYGEGLSGFIHVHHIKPISEIGKQYKVNPISDLRPVCPNCHAVIHSGDKVLSVAAAKALMRRAATNSK